MTDDKFHELIKFVVQPFGDTLVKKYGGLSWKLNWQNILQAEYGEIRNSVRAKMKLEPDLPHQRIDRHKIAASLVNAILITRPIELLSGVSSPSAGHRLVNETLAFLVGVGVVQHFILARLKKYQPGSVTYIQGDITFPPANEVVYPEHVYKAIYQAKTNGSIDEFILANLFFLIESYHLQSRGLNTSVIPPESQDAIAGLF